MPLSLGIGDKALKFDGVRGLMAVILVLALCYLAIKIGNQEAVGALIMLAVSAAKDYVNAQAKNGNGDAKPPA